nr:MAG: GxxExxY protein [Chloroflexota bacterium]
MGKLLFEQETYAIIGAAIAVHRELGPGFLEAVYQEALEVELQLQGIPFERQKPLTIRYRGQPLRKMYVADYVCCGQIIIEIKALGRLTGAEEAQLINYLKASGLRVGLLINFGAAGKLVWRRLVC